MEPPQPRSQAELVPGEDFRQRCCKRYRTSALVCACGRDQGGEHHMPQSEKFEVLVLGSGIGGKLIAWHIARPSLAALWNQAVQLAQGRWLDPSKYARGK